MNLKLLRFEVAGPADIPVQIEAAAAARAQALFVMPDDPLLYNKHVLIVQLAAKHRLPDFYWTSDYVDDGGLMSYGENLGDSYSATAEYILKVARGGNPAEIPVAQPTQFQLVINRRTSKALGLAIPQSLLVRADRVIE
jgi:putative ABC transport system substrate-binding protein